MTAFETSDFGVYTSTLIRDGAPVLLAIHDEDGDWQFLAGSESSPDDCILVHVHHLLADDPSLNEIADLPLGWKAWRRAVDAAWHREQIPDDQGRV